MRGIRLLGDLFTTYALAEQVPIFFSSFRFGQTPVGIVDGTSYWLIKNGAPELTGQWEMTPHPGTVQEDGSISRWYIGNGTGSIIFNDTLLPKEDCWGFLQWWTSEEIQTQFAFEIMTNLNGLWLSSNLAALANTPIDASDVEVIFESVKWMRDVPRSPGQYLLERSLSDVWNRMVFDGVPAQVAVDNALIDIQREFRRKMFEFGLIDEQGQPTKPYTVREIDWVLERIEAAR
jgi:ABC-type glycerol-3-phosphate transport system substrate-binding protein